MKKIFSAFLLMTMMVASVGSFVSCSDIEESIAAVDEATKDNAAAVEALKSEVAALKTALATAQADAAAAKTEANAAKQAAATAKAEAIAAALAEIEKVNGDVDAMQAVIDSINAALTGKADKATVELLQATVEEYKALIDANGAATTANAAAIAALEEALAALGENVDPEQFAEVVAKMEAIDAALIAFQSRIQSVAYVPQTMTAPAATQFTVGKEKTDYIIQLAYQVSPVSAAAELENAEVYVKGIATKAAAPAKFETKILSVDEATGMVEVVAYIPEETVEAVELAANEVPGVVIALAIENENGVEITSTYEKFAATTDELANYVTIKDFKVAADRTMSYTYEMPYDTAIADSKVDMINPEFIVNVDGMFEETPLAEALEYLGLEDVTVERNPENRFGVKYIDIKNNSLYDNNATPTAATTDDIKVLKDTQSADKKDVTVEFSADYAKVADATKLIGKNVVVTLKEGFFTIAGDKLPKTTITYVVAAKENPVTIEIEDIESAWLPVAKFIDVPYTGVDQADFNKYHPTTGDNAVKANVVDADENVVGTVTIMATSHDDMVVTLNEGFVWPEETTTYTVEKEFKGAVDAKTATQTVYSYEFTITLEGRPEDVEYEYAPATLPTLTLTAAPNPNDPTDMNGMTAAQLASKVAVGTVVTDITKEYASYYEENELVNTISAALEAATWSVYKLDVDTDTVDETALALTANTVKFDYATKDKVENSAFVFLYDAENYKKLSAAKAIQIRTTITLNGVKYVISANTKVSSWATPTVSIVAGKLSPEFQGAQPVKYFTTTEVVYVMWDDDNDATTPDVVKKDKDGNKIIDWYTTYINNSSIADYVLPQTFYFNDYVTVKNVAAAAKANYIVRWSVAPVAGVHYETNADGDIVTRSAKVGGFPVFKLGTSELPSFKLNDKVNDDDFNGDVNAAYNDKRYYAVALSDLESGAWELNWKNSKVRNYTVKFELVDITKKATNAPANASTLNPAHYPAVSSINVEFKTPATIKSVDATNVELKWTPATQTVSANVAAGVTVTDMFDVAVNTLGYDRAINTFWNNFSYSSAKTSEDVNTTATDESLTAVYTTGATSGLLDVYKQTITVVAFDDDALVNTPKVWISNNGGFTGTYNETSKCVEGTNFTFNTQTGAFTFESTAAPANDVTFTVHVAVSHMNDNGTPIEKAVNIVVKK